MKRVCFLVIAFFGLSIPNLMAQCAMCRSTLENNFSNGNPTIGAGINTGILYLLVMPYLAIFFIGYFWYKASKHAKNRVSGRVASR